MRFLATLFGIVMLSHQMGGFLGAWLGGMLFEPTGSYDLLWIIDIVLAAGAGLIHLPIKEAPKLRPALVAWGKLGGEMLATTASPYPGITQEVAPKESQRGQKPTT